MRKKKIRVKGVGVGGNREIERRKMGILAWEVNGKNKLPQSFPRLFPTRTAGSLILW